MFDTQDEHESTPNNTTASSSAAASSTTTTASSVATSTSTTETHELFLQQLLVTMILIMRRVHVAQLELQRTTMVVFMRTNRMVVKVSETLSNVLTKHADFSPLLALRRRL